jgi:hypothetical protein
VQLLALQAAPLDDRDRQVEVLGEFVVVPSQSVILGFELVEPGDRDIGDRRVTDVPMPLEVRGDLGEMSAEGGVGQADPAGDREYGRRLASRFGQLGDRPQHGVDGGQVEAAGHGFSRWWRSTKPGSLRSEADLPPAAIGEDAEPAFDVGRRVKIASYLIEAEPGQRRTQRLQDHLDCCFATVQLAQRGVVRREGCPSPAAHDA